MGKGLMSLVVLVALLAVLMTATLAFGQEANPQFYVPDPSSQLGPDVGPPGAGGQPAPKPEAQPQAPTSIQVGSATVTIQAGQILIQGPVQQQSGGGRKGHSGGRGHGRKAVKTAGLTTAEVQALVRRELQGYAKASDIQRVERKLDALIARSTAPAAPGPTASATTAASTAAMGGTGTMMWIPGVPNWLTLVAAAVILYLIFRPRHTPGPVRTFAQDVAGYGDAADLRGQPDNVGPAEGEESQTLFTPDGGVIRRKRRWPARNSYTTLGEGETAIVEGDGRTRTVRGMTREREEHPQRGNGPAADADAGRTRRNGNGNRRNGGTTTRRVAETTEPAPGGAGEAAVEAVKRNGHEAQEGDGHGQE